MATPAEHRSVFDLSPGEEALTGLREVDPLRKRGGSAEPASGPDDRGTEDDRPRECSRVREVSDKMACSACRCSFTHREEQMEHYKLDWHRFNLKRRMAGAPPVTAEEFEKKTGAGDMSSISGSESDSDEEEDEGESEKDAGNANSNTTSTESSDDAGLISGRMSSKVLFQSAAGQYLSVHRCVLQGKSDGDQDLGSTLKSISKETLWIILMTGGGHFAGAVFRGKDVLQHKTFHRYTVRAKRGTAQGLKDSQSRGHAPKSAGAALRRHNEAALVKDIQDLLVSWAEHLKEASVIFVRAPSYNKTIFFGGRAAPLDRRDPRIRALPFATRRATFREVQRVHEVLSTVHVYGKDADVSAVSSVSKKAWKKRVSRPARVDADWEEGSGIPTHAPTEDICEGSDGEEGGEIQLEMVELTLGTLDLQELEIRAPRPRRRRRKKEENKEKGGVTDLSNTEDDNRGEQVPEAPPGEESSQETLSESKSRRKVESKKPAGEPLDEAWEYSVRDALFTACKVGDVDGLCGILGLPGEAQEGPEGDASDAPSPRTLLAKPIDSSGFTLLHVASVAAQKAVVRLLLDAGADPALRDSKGQTPYVVAPDKDTRNVFRKYMGENPDRYDYSRAQVPGPLTAEIESKKAEKKKAQKAMKKQREKTLKEEKRRQELEAEEKRRFASLTDREKRALAAERRLAKQAAAAGVSNVARCWLCGESLLGKIPFKYLDYSFCSPGCVQAHRKTNTAAGKS